MVSKSRIFVSYRHQDTGEITPHLGTRLETFFGAGAVFVDTEDLMAGDDFRDQISRAIENCTVMIVMIGSKWCDIKSESGELRLEEENDYVRIEIESALARGVKIIPLLVNGAKMPSEKELPESISKLAFLQAETIRSGRPFSSDTNSLIKVLLTCGVEPPEGPAPFEFGMIGFGIFLVLGGIGALLPVIYDARANVPHIEETYDDQLRMGLIASPICFGSGVLLICTGGWWCCGRKEAERKARYIGSPYHSKPKCKSAVISLALGISSAGFNLLTGIPAIVYGIRGLREIRDVPGRLAGTLHAYLGMTFGILGPFVSVVFIYLMWSFTEPYRTADSAKELIRDGAKETALQVLNDAVEAYPWCSAPRKQRGQLFASDSRYDDAAEDFTIAIEMYSDPHFDRGKSIIADTYLLRSDAREKAGDAAGAAKDREAAEEILSSDS
jgi:hypothetical protein